MKKYLFFLLALCLLLTGCAAKQAALPAAQEVADKIAKSQAFSGELTRISQNRTEALLDLEAESYREAVMLMDASMATPEMVAVLTAENEEKASQLAQHLQDYLDSLAEEYEDYRPEEMPKLNDAQVLQNGAQCVLAVAPDQAAARDAARKAWGK